MAGALQTRPNSISAVADGAGCVAQLTAASTVFASLVGIAPSAFSIAGEVETRVKHSWAKS